MEPEQIPSWQHWIATEPDDGPADDASPRKRFLTLLQTLLPLFALLLMALGSWHELRPP